MEGRCERHLFDQAVDLCGRCGFEFCADCLVYSFGASKPPFCLPCAVKAAGLRQSSGGMSGGRKARKQFQQKREEFLARRSDAPVSGGVRLDDSWLARVAEAG